MATSRSRTRALDLPAHSGGRSLHRVFFLPRRSRRRSLSLLESGACVRAPLGTFLLLVRVGVGIHLSRSLLDLLLGLSLFHCKPSLSSGVHRRPYPLVVHREASRIDLPASPPDRRVTAGRPERSPCR